jgi:transposase
MANYPIAGFDVSKRFSDMCILGPDNKVFARMRVHHNVSDFKKACGLLKRAEKEFDMIPLIIMEATGHYHRLLFRFLKNAGYKVIVVNPIQTDSIKNISVRKVKNDKVDAYRIAILYRLKELRPTNMPVEAISDIRNLCRQYYDISDDCTAYMNKLIAIMDELFPGFNNVFGSIASKTALEILSCYPTPEDILNAPKDELIKIISKTGRKGLKWALNKYNKLIEIATEVKPIFIKHSSSSILVNTTITFIKTFQDQLKQIKNEIYKVIADNPDYIGKAIELLDSIPGIDTITAAAILGEIGDFSAFKSPKQLVAFFGIDPSQKNSGQFKSTDNKISKRGSKILRRVLFTTAMANVRKKRNKELFNPVLFEYYNQKLVSKPKKVALVAVMHKLVYIIFAVLRDQKPFVLRTPEEHKKLLALKASQHQKKTA